MHKIEHPLKTLQSEHEVQLALCNVLEQIADDLPASFNPAAISTARELLDQAFLIHMRFEEEQLFPRLRYRTGHRANFSRILDQLSREHHRDECSLMEVAEEFMDLKDGRKCRNAEMLGYMLRGFFEGQRSHIELESIAILPVATEVLTSEDLEGMKHWLASSESARPRDWATRSLQALRIL